MKQEDIQLFLLSLLKDHVEQNSIICNEEITENTRLIGSKALLDSLGLVSFIVEVEQSLEEEYDFSINIVSEKAMSRTTSPFISIKTLSKFIAKEVNE